MPKQRILGPEFWNDPDVSELSRDERLLFAGMITSCADDEGRLLAEPVYLRKMVFGYDEDLTRADVARMADNIVAKCRNVVRYEFDGQQYIFLQKFAKHQQIKYVVRSKLPPPPQTDAPSYKMPQIAENSTNLRENAENSLRVEKSRVDRVDRVESSTDPPASMSAHEGSADFASQEETAPEAPQPPKQERQIRAVPKNGASEPEVGARGIPIRRNAAGYPNLADVMANDPPRGSFKRPPRPQDSG